MIPTPFRFFKMKKEEFLANTTQFKEAKLGVAPKALDPVDMVFAAGELVFVVMNAPVFVATQEQAVVAEPAVGIDGGFGKHLSFDDRLQLCPGAVFHHPSEDFAATFEQSNDGRFTTGSAAAATSHPARTKIGFVDLNFSGKRPRFFSRQFHHSAAQHLIDPLARLAIDHHQFARAQRGHIRTKHLQ